MKKNKKHTRFPVWLKRWFRRTWILFVTLVVLFAISLTVFRALTPWAAQYKDALEARLSTLFGTVVSIKEMKTSWYWFEPVLKLDGVEIAEKDESVLKVKELLVGIDLPRSFWHWRIQPGVLFVEDATLNFREDEAHWQLDGVALDADVKSVPQAEYSTVLGWLLAHQKIVMRRVGVKLHWKDGRTTTIMPATVVASNRNGHYRVKGHASLAGDAPSALSLMADLSIPSGFSSNVRGQVYLSAERVNFSEWHTLFSRLGFDVIKGLGEVQLWLDIQNSRLTSAQAVVRFRDILWQLGNEKRTRKIERFGANMAWEETPDGWKWAADHIRFRANEVTWPENAMTVTYRAEEDNYRVFVKTLLLQPLHALLEGGPDSLKAWFDMKPRGQLNDSQLGFQGGQLNYVLSRFSRVSWDAKDTIPAVNNLSGALAWEPKEGHLELDGEQVELSFKDKPTLELGLLNASVVWKALSHGWRVSLDRGVVKHGHGLFSGRGVLDEVAPDNWGKIRANLAFATHDSTFWWPYLPEGSLKPKLKTWLMHDVKKVEQFSGRVQLKGALKDFPFDETPGEFLVTSSMSGVDLRFNPNWPLVKNMSSTLTLDKRLLTADISEADFVEGYPMHDAHLVVRDLGLNHEVLSVQGQVDAPLEEMQKYIKNSPLHAKLFKLDALNFKKTANLSLAMQFPFYPGPKFTVNGIIDFKENDLFLKEVSDTFGLSRLTGKLKFDEHGVVSSYLSAHLFDELMTLWVRSNHGENPHLAIDMSGHAQAQGLQNTLALPALSLCRGRTALKAELMLTDDPNDLDHIHMTSSLKGVAIDLPEPFGKQYSEAKPLVVDTHFNLTRGMRLQVNYDKQLSTDLWFAGKSPGMELARGEVVFGEGKAVLRDKPGASIRGYFKTFDWAPWAETVDKLKLKQTPSTDFLPGFRVVSLDFGEVDAFNQHYQNLQLYAQRQPDNVWSVLIKEDNMSADLKYIPQQNLLSGSLSEWQFKRASSEGSEAGEPTSYAWSPRKIPSLNLKVGRLQVDDVNAGRLTLKGTHVSDEVWRLDSGKLSSEAYDFSVKGQWQEAPRSETKVAAHLQVHSLEKALEHWHISPAVEAHEGDLQFVVDWEGAPHDFSVKGATGKIQIVFKEGRIPNLSPETEKKMALGKLLSILSLQTIPRRLKLDFSDLAKPGYSFDKFDGNFVLAHGIMETEDSAIDGPVARATMKGSLNLDKRLYDMSLHITPHITASLPVVATIAGGPVAGIATWVASKLINQGMEKISGYTYDVSGPWSEPVVQQVHIYRKQQSTN